MYVRRKVYSNQQPVEEQLYSVTMTEEQYDLFSEFMDAYEEALFSADNYYYDQAGLSKAERKVQAAARQKEIEAAFKNQPKDKIVTDALTKKEKEAAEKARTTGRYARENEAATAFTKEQQKANKAAGKKAPKMSKKEWEKTVSEGRKAAAKDIAAAKANLLNAKDARQLAKLKKGAKIGGIATLGAGAAAGLGYGAYRAVKD